MRHGYTVSAGSGAMMTTGVPSGSGSSRRRAAPGVRRRRPRESIAPASGRRQRRLGDDEIRDRPAADQVLLRGSARGSRACSRGTRCRPDRRRRSARPTQTRRQCALVRSTPPSTSCRPELLEAALEVVPALLGARDGRALAARHAQEDVPRCRRGAAWRRRGRAPLQRGIGHRSLGSGGPEPMLAQPAAASRSHRAITGPGRRPRRCGCGWRARGRR